MNSSSYDPEDHFIISAFKEEGIAPKLMIVIVGGVPQYYQYQEEVDIAIDLQGLPADLEFEVYRSIEENYWTPDQQPDIKQAIGNQLNDTIYVHSINTYITDL